MLSLDNIKDINLKVYKKFKRKEWIIIHQLLKSWIKNKPLVPEFQMKKLALQLWNFFQTKKIK